MRAWLFGFIAVLVLACGADVRAQTIRLDAGRIQGTSHDGVTRFLGVPYAAPPLGELRWRAPAPPPRWRGVRQASEYSASCMQAPRGPWGPYTSEYVEQARAPSEDCLYLNIWTPSVQRGDQLPILVWIHGGAFIGGASSVPIYDGEALARTGIIVVSINYRLGAFGFFAPDEQGPANSGVLDAIAALRWLHSNAAAFGGDADRITIAGQSAGAAMVNILLVSREAEGLFAGAISQSMPLGAVRMRSRDEARRARELYMRAFGANSVAALRDVSAERILEATQHISPGPMAPIVDGVTLEGDPLELAAQGRLHPGPLMMGVTADEGVFEGNLIAYRTTFAEAYGRSASQFLEAYPARTDSEAIMAARTSGRDRRAFGLRQPLAHRAPSAAPVFLYEFTHVEPGPAAARFGAFHTSEVPYAFATLSMSPERPFTEEDRRVSDRLRDYWSNFVKHGDPNGADAPAWLHATAQAPVIMELGGVWRALPEPAAARNEFFRAYISEGGRASLF